MLEYRALVLLDHVSPGMTVKKVLSIYKKWHVRNRPPTWGRIPLSCSCVVCFPHCVCQDTILLASLFDPEVQVPPDWDGICQQNVQVNRGHGRAQEALAHRAARVRQKDFGSKVKYLNVSAPPAPKPVVVLPPLDEAVMPSSNEDFEV